MRRGKSKHRPRDDEMLYGGVYPFIQTGDIKKAYLYINEYEKTYSNYGLSQSKLWKKGTLCITIAANIAETAILSMDACFPDSVIGWCSNNQLTNNLFIKYYFDYYKEQLKRLSVGGAQENLNLDKLEKIYFNIPSLQEQNNISNFLSKIDERIQTQIKIISDYKTLKKGIIQHIFNANAQYSKVHLNIILKEISKKNKRQIHNNVLSISNSLGFIKQSEQFVDREIASSNTSNYKIVNKNEYAYNPARINVGSIARLTNYDCGIVSPMYTIFEINTTRIIYEYFDYFLHSFTFQKQLNQRLEGSVRQCLTFNSMQNIEIELPPIEVQIEISKNMKHLDSKIKIESGYLNLLKSQKDYLLKNMFV